MQELTIQIIINSEVWPNTDLLKTSNLEFMSTD